MIIDSAAFNDIPGLIGATLSESADDASTLSLSFEGFGPAWLEYMQPITVMHRGRVLFHGKITSLARNNAGGEMTSSATASNFLWLLARQTLGAQIAEVRAAAANEAWSGLQSSANAAMASWKSLADSCRIDAPGWVANADGSEAAESVITLDASRARYSFGAYMERERAITAWTALLEMKSCNPDCSYRVNYVSGAIEVISLGKADSLAWDTARMGIIAANDIAPQYEEALTGVAVVVSWSAEGGASGVAVRQYPPGLDMAQSGVKVFAAGADNALQAAAQADHMIAQCRAYYEAANALQWGGSVSAKLEDVPASPLACRLCLTGPGAHESWHGMQAMVSEVEWDFMEMACTLSLGRTVDEPELHELQFDDHESEDDSTEADAPQQPESTEALSTALPDSEEEFSTEEASTQEASTWDGASTTWDAASTWEDSASASGSAEGSAAGSGSGSAGPDSGSACGSGSTGSGSGSGSGTQPQTTTMPQGSQGSGSGGSSGSGSSPGGSGSGCDCASQWSDLETWKKDVEDRLAKLEAGQPGVGSGSGSDVGSGSASAGGEGSEAGSACGCADELKALQEKVQALEARSINFDSTWFNVSGQNVTFNAGQVKTAVDSIIQGVTIDVTASGLSETTAFGTIAVDTSGGGDLGNASFTSSVHY